LRSEVKPKSEFLEAIVVETEETLANIGKAMSVSTNTK
jgi:hypothetical protein